MGCNINGNGKSGPHVIDNEPSGLILNHAYGISDIIEFTDPYEKFTQKKIRLLRLRNPWGKSEFNGAWSDNSDEMVKYSKMM